MIGALLIFAVVTAGLVAFLYAVNWDSGRYVDVEFYVHYPKLRKQQKELLQP